MKQEFGVVNGQVHVSLAGSLYVEGAAGLREKLLEYIQSGYRDFTVDLKGVDYIDSSGLGVLVAIQKRALQNGGRVIIKGLQGTVKELFEMTRLTKVFDIQE
jgi:anti-sigma B factor antagonist